jgi:hypothetical protein
MKIHATRVVAPTPGQEHGTRWQVAVTFDDNNVETFDRVDVVGNCSVVSLPDGEPTPHVYVEPHRNARVIAWTGNESEEIQ